MPDAPMEAVVLVLSPEKMDTLLGLKAIIERSQAHYPNLFFALSGSEIQRFVALSTQSGKDGSFHLAASPGKWWLCLGSGGLSEKNPNPLRLRFRRSGSGKVVKQTMTYNGNVTLSTQAQVNAFAQCYSIINGNLLIRNSGVNTLSNLDKLTTVTGSVTIRLTSLTNLNGLNSLATIGGTLSIYTNNYGTKLSSLDGLEALSSVGGNIIIYQNFTLSDCCALYDLINAPGAVGGYVSIYQNKSGCDNVAQINAICASIPLIAPPGNGQLQPGASLAQEKPSILLFPNPALDEVKLVLPLDFQSGIVKFYDLQGRLILKQDLEENTNVLLLDLSQVVPGAYLVKVQLDEHLFIEKLMVE